MLDGAGAHPSRSGRAHLAWVAAGAGIPRRRLGEVLEVVGLAGAAHRPVRTYSLGMVQRLGLATALLGDPEVLVLDEPVNGLDPEGIRWMRGLLRHRAEEGGTVLLSSHVLSELTEVADDVVVIAGGRVRAAGTLEEVVAGYPSLEDAFFRLTAPDDDGPGAGPGGAGGSGWCGRVRVVRAGPGGAGGAGAGPVEAGPCGVGRLAPGRGSHTGGPADGRRESSLSAAHRSRAAGQAEAGMA